MQMWNDNANDDDGQDISIKKAQVSSGDNTTAPSSQFNMLKKSDLNHLWNRK